MGLAPVALPGSQEPALTTLHWFCRSPSLRNWKWDLLPGNDSRVLPKASVPGISTPAHCKAAERPSLMPSLTHGHQDRSQPELPLKPGFASPGPCSTLGTPCRFPVRNPLGSADAQKPLVKLLLLFCPSLCTTLKVHLKMFKPPGSSCCSRGPPASRVPSPAEVSATLWAQLAFSQPGIRWDLGCTEHTWAALGIYRAEGSMGPHLRSSLVTPRPPSPMNTCTSPPVECHLCRGERAQR